MKARGCLWVMLGALLVCACNDEEPPPQPSSFDRPTRVAFACFDIRQDDDPKVAGLANCDYTSGAAIENELITHALHALVVQSSRGEVGAVDLLKLKTLDSRRDIPGYTFLPVGELPTAIVVPASARNAGFTYVANAGSRDITVLRTRAFRRLTAEEPAIVQTVPLPGGSLDSPLDMVLAPDEDALFVSIPQTGRLLRVPIQRCDQPQAPEPPGDAGSSDASIDAGISDASVDAGIADASVDAGSDASVDAGLDGAVQTPQPCAEGEIDANGITEIPLAESVAKASMSGAPDIAREKYKKTCDYTGPVSNASLPVPTLPDGAPQTQPKPTGLAVDDFCQGDQPCTRRLLVADEALPLIHVVDLGALATGDASAAVQPPIITGVPTRSVAVSPRVPVDLSLTPAETQYVYAIDATDGSVLVTQNGRLLEVGVDGARPDRIALGDGTTTPVAMSLRIMTPDFDVHGPAGQYAVRSSTLPPPNQGAFCLDTAHTEPLNSRLRGVFLAVGTTDSAVRIVDVHDMALAECRGCSKYVPDCVCNEDAAPDARTNACTKCEQIWDPYPVVRHRLRIGVTAQPDAPAPPLRPFAAPAFVTRSGVITVRETGSTSDPQLKGLDCVTCRADQAGAFPTSPTSASTDDAGTDDSMAPCNAQSSRVCVENDPWVRLEDWLAMYHGTIPGSRGGDTRITPVDGRGELRTESRFCNLGVLGDDVLGADTGDQVVILNELAPDSVIEATPPHARVSKSGTDATFESETRAACQALVRARDNTTKPVPIAFKILEAYADHLVLSPNLTPRPDRVSAWFENDLQFVNKCFGNATLTYEVRVGRGYIVLGRNSAGFIHRVRAEDGSGHCVQDAAQKPERTGRALEGVPFDNGRVSFQIRVGGDVEIDTSLALQLQSNTPKTISVTAVSVNQQVVSSLPVDMRWSDESNALYVVDVASRGLMQIPVDPYPSSIARSFQ